MPQYCMLILGQFGNQFSPSCMWDSRDWTEVVWLRYNPLSQFTIYLFFILEYLWPILGWNYRCRAHIYGWLTRYGIHFISMRKGIHRKVFCLTSLSVLGPHDSNCLMVHICNLYLQNVCLNMVRSWVSCSFIPKHKASPICPHWIEVFIDYVLFLSRQVLKHMKNSGFLLVFYFQIFNVILTFVWLENMSLRIVVWIKYVEGCFYRGTVIFNHVKICHLY